MTTSPPHPPPTAPQQPRIYPPLLHPLSTTISRWAPLSAVDIHALRTHNIYNPSLLSKDKLVWHWGNHPVQWVRVVGVVVGIDDFGLGSADGGGNGSRNNGRSGRRVLTVDDSSGMCVECCAVVPLGGVEVGRDEGGSRHLRQLEALSSRIHDTKKEDKEQPTLQDPAVSWKDIDIGRVIKVKGIAGMWRDVMQINVIKIVVVRSTDEEVRCWGEVGAFRKEVLNVPWVVSQEEEERLRKKQERRTRKGKHGKEDDERRKKRKLKEREKQKKRKQEEAVEQEKARERERAKKKRDQESAGLDPRNKVNYPTLATRRRLAGKYPALGI